MNEFLVKKYQHEPFSYSIWRLKHVLLGEVVQCVDPMEHDFGVEVVGKSIKGTLVLEMAEVKIANDNDIYPSFSVIKNNFKLSDGSRVSAIGIAKNLNIESSEFSLKSVIDIDVQAEVLPVFTDGEKVEVIGLLKFKPDQVDYEKI